MTPSTSAAYRPRAGIPDVTRPPQTFWRRYGWPIGIVAALTLSAAANIFVMFVAKADPAFAVEPDYYQKAVAWDATMEQQRTNATLAWRATAALTRATPSQPGRITVALFDATGAPIGDAQVQIEAMHNARASQRYEASLAPTRDGSYSSNIDAHRPGQWEVRVTAIRGNDRFTQSLRIDAP